MRVNARCVLQDALGAVEDVREYDVPFHIRYAIDAGIRVGNWYTVAAAEGTVTVTPRPDLIFRGEPRVCAFDIETTKLPLHFPNAEHDQVRARPLPLRSLLRTVGLLFVLAVGLNCWGSICWVSMCCYIDHSAAMNSGPARS